MVYCETTAGKTSFSSRVTMVPKIKQQETTNLLAKSVCLSVCPPPHFAVVFCWNVCVWCASVCWCMCEYVYM